MSRLHALAWAMAIVSLTLQPAFAQADWPASPLVNVPVSTGAGTQYVYAVVPDGQGGMITIWQDSRDDDGAIYAQRLNAAGATQWLPNGVSICVAGNTQLYPLAIPDGAGGAIIAWQDFRNGATADIYVQRVDATGETLWDAGGVLKGHPSVPEGSNRG